MDLVLVGDDGSDDALAAIRWATRLATDRGMELIAVHVPAARDEGEPPARVERTVQRTGHPAAGIMDAAHDLDASIIVLGRRGGGGFSASPIGSVAVHVAAVSSRPVVVVPSAATHETGPLVRRIVVGVDGMPETDDALRWTAREFADAHFTAVHALELAPAFVQMEDSADTERLYDAARARADALLRERWCRPLEEANVPFDAVLEEGGAVEILLTTATRVGADLLVVSRRDRHLRRGTLGGVSQRILAYAPCAAAMVPAPS